MPQCSLHLLNGWRFRKRRGGGATDQMQHATASSSFAALVLNGQAQAPRHRGQGHFNFCIMPVFMRNGWLNPQICQSHTSQLSQCLIAIAAFAAPATESCYSAEATESSSIAAVSLSIAPRVLAVHANNPRIARIYPSWRSDSEACWAAIHLVLKSFALIDSTYQRRCVLARQGVFRSGHGRQSFAAPVLTYFCAVYMRSELIALLRLLQFLCISNCAWLRGGGVCTRAMHV